MLRHRKIGKRGFTLTELLVVLAIGIVLSAFAIPAISNLGLFARDELKGTARDLLTLLQAARIYGATYNVDTAVVYVTDNYVAREVDATNTPGLATPMVDTLTGGGIRYLTGAAIMYELPQKSTPFQGRFVPAPLDQGIFRSFQGGMIVPLELSRRFGPTVPLSEDVGVLYTDDRPRPVSGLGNVGQLGLSYVEVYPDGYGPLAPGGPDTSVTGVEFTESFLAHRFTTGGKLATTGGGKERYTFFVTPPYDLVVDERTGTDGELLSVPIEITRASGRVKIATE